MGNINEVKPNIPRILIENQSKRKSDPLVNIVSNISRNLLAYLKIASKILKSIKEMYVHDKIF